MSRKKKYVLSAAAVLCALLVALVYLLALRPYLQSRPSFSVKDTLPDGGGKAATVIILGGQSNASGCSLDEYLQKNVTPEQYAEYQNGYDNVYINYLSGLHASGEFVKCATLQGEIEGGFGPELGLAEKLSEAYPDRTFFIIKFAWGGTNLFDQWLSPSSEGKTGDLYKQFTAYVETSIKYLISKNYDVQIEGMCWMQGESDCFSVADSEAYGEHLGNFTKDIRKKFAKYAAPDGIAFVDAYIADNPVYWVYCEAVNRGKREVAEQSPMNALVDTIAAGLTCANEPADSPDLAHYDSMSEILLGHLFAEEIMKYLD